MKWLQCIFLPETCPPEPRPRLLLLDGHGSHCTSEFILKCFENNVHIIYLPPHTSHILQSLDLSVFSRIKTLYRAEMDEFVKLEDAAPVKKIRFIRYYQTARQYALTPSTITAGWRGAGLVPWNPAKVLESSQILGGAAPLSTAPPSTPRTQRHSSPSLLRTPTNRQSLYEGQNQLLRTYNMPRAVRSYLGKTLRAVDQLFTTQALHQQQIDAQAVQLEEFTVQKKRKLAVADANDAFAGVEAIRDAQEAQARLTAAAQLRDLAGEARRTSAQAVNSSIADMTFEFSIFEQ
jgi:DDE superfamily endonuclease